MSELKFIQKLYHIHISNHLDRFWLRCYSKYIAIYSQMYTMLYTRYIQSYDVICKLQLVEQFAYVARSQWKPFEAVICRREKWHRHDPPQRQVSTLYSIYVHIVERILAINDYSYIYCTAWHKSTQNTIKLSVNNWQMTFELGRKIIKWKITKINVEKIACDFHKVSHFVCATTSPTYYMLILYEKILYTNTFSSLGFYIFFFFSAFFCRRATQDEVFVRLPQGVKFLLPKYLCICISWLYLSLPHLYKTVCVGADELMYLFIILS